MRSVGSLAAEYTISQPAVTKHIRVLEKAGLVQKLRNKQTVYVMTSPEHRDSILTAADILLSTR